LFFLTLMHIFEYSLFVKFSSEYSIWLCHMYNLYICQDW
jgi:hypothetical protein